LSPEGRQLKTLPRDSSSVVAMTEAACVIDIEGNLIASNFDGNKNGQGRLAFRALKDSVGREVLRHDGDLVAKQIAALFNDAKAAKRPEYRTVAKLRRRLSGHSSSESEKNKRRYATSHGESIRRE